MAASLPTHDMTVAEVLELWPETVTVFQELKTACVGCPMAPFDAISDVAQIYKLERSQILAALHGVILAGDRETAEQASNPDDTEAT